jgi:SAM-dependent methyltransferase
MLEQALPLENIYGHTKKLAFIRAHLDAHRRRVQAPITVLDFGCGNGSAVSRFLMGEGIEYVGVDFHEPSLAHARQHFESPHAHFFPEVPPNLHFDVLVYADVLEHLDDPLTVLRAHCRQLKPDGLLIGSVPNGYGPFENEKRIARWFGLDFAHRVWKHSYRATLSALVRVRKRVWPKPADLLPCPDAGFALPYNSTCGHVQFFTRGGLLRLLRGAGFRVEVLQNGAFVGAPLSAEYFLRGPRIARWNARLADFMPAWAVSTWYFTARPDDQRLAE